MSTKRHHAAELQAAHVPSNILPSLRHSQQITYSSCAAGFMGIAVFQFLAAFHAIIALGSPTKTLSNALGAGVCIIAGFHYMWMRSNFVRGVAVTATRFSDWYITTTLMLVEFFTLSETLASGWGWCVGSCVACQCMLVCGHIATVKKSNGTAYALPYCLGILSGVFLTAFFLIGTLLPNSPHPNSWLYFFAGIWLLYPLAFFDPWDTSYNVLDFISKGVFGLVLGINTFLY